MTEHTKLQAESTERPLRALMCGMTASCARVSAVISKYGR